AAPTPTNEPYLFAYARRSDQALRQIERGCWELTLQPVAAPLSTALGTNFDTLPDYWQFIGDADTATHGPNLLPAADFEDLQAALASGWRYFQHPQSALTTSIKPHDSEVHGGKSALRLEVAAANPAEPPVQVETSPMWLVSPPMQVEAGRVMLIHGWVNIPKRITGSVDGLLILDSISGEPLAERIMQTKGWQEFSLYRAAPRSGSMTVTFALTGLGEAFLDDVTVEVVERPKPTTAAAAPQQGTMNAAALPPGTAMQISSAQGAAPAAAGAPNGLPYGNSPYGSVPQAYGAVPQARGAVQARPQ
ncbi:MAG TPA: hypothetical protein VMF30_07315, partial [Pirellulales bacterium]|nr:hypothetical protein [Pirellulales bacterium]